MATSTRQCQHKHPAYRVARARALARSGNLCQLCGRRAATEAHHWAIEYPREEDTTPDDLIALCSYCHEVATLLRRADREGVGTFAVLAIFKNSIREAYEP